MSTPPEDVPVIRAISALVIMHGLISNSSTSPAHVGENPELFIDVSLAMADRLLAKTGITE